MKKFSVRSFEYSRFVGELIDEGIASGDENFRIRVSSFYERVIVQCNPRGLEFLRQICSFLIYEVFLFSELFSSSSGESVFCCVFWIFISGLCVIREFGLVRADRDCASAERRTRREELSRGIHRPLYGPEKNLPFGSVKGWETRRGGGGGRLYTWDFCVHRSLLSRLVRSKNFARTRAHRVPSRVNRNSWVKSCAERRARRNGIPLHWWAIVLLLSILFYLLFFFNNFFSSLISLFLFIRQTTMYIVI